MDAGKKVTLMVAGAPITFTSRIQACKKVKIGNRYPPGPCPGWKLGTKKAAGKTVPRGGDIVKKAIAKREASAQKAERERIVKQLMIRMAAGEKFEIEQDLFPDMMESLLGTDPANLAMMNVKGAKNKNLFQHHIRDIPRKEMPAIPPTVAEMMPLIAELHRMGVEVELVEMDPRELQYTQSELSAPKVAQMQVNMKGGFMPGGGILASQENAIADGHHRAAGAAGASLMHELGQPGYKPVLVTVVRAKMPIDDLLAVAQRFSGERKSITEKP